MTVRQTDGRKEGRRKRKGDAMNEKKIEGERGGIKMREKVRKGRNGLKK